MTRNVLVTGGAGYVGAHACKALAAAGYLPVTFDNLSRGHRRLVGWGPLIVGDLADPSTIRTALEQWPCCAVLHFAAFAYVGESMQNPQGYFQNNVANTINLIGVMIDKQIDTLVFSSSCAVYGAPESLPIAETQSPAPISPYGETKLIVETILQWHGRCSGLKWLALRYFNAAGADPDGEIGELHDPEPHLFPLAIETARNSRTALPIYGADFPTPDGTAVRDYVHVSDLADAHVRALGYLEGGGQPAALNLGTGTGHSVLEVIAAVEDAAGRPVATQAAPRRAGDPARLVADASLAQQVLHWRPANSDLASIAKTAWRWHETRNLQEA